MNQPQNHTPRRPSAQHNESPVQHGTYSDGTGTCLTYRKRRVAPLTGALLCALVFFLVILVCILVISQNRQPQSPAPATGIPPVSAADPPESTPSPQPSIIPHDTVTLPASAVAEGNLILVNAEHPYVFPQSQPQTVLYGNKSPVYVLSNASISLNTSLFPIFDGMLVDFSRESGCKEVLVTSGYRSYEFQEELYESRVKSQGAEQAALYVALPGNSEHHAGLAVDMVIYKDGRQYYFPDYEDAAWLIEHAPDYGFILRYTEDKQSVTQCAPEPWHYRYVGTPHARLITALGLCFEEYHEYLHQFTWEGTRLLTDGKGDAAEADTAAALPTDGYMIYYVPAAPSGGDTDIPVPAGSEYEISGDNAGGFIVTVTLR